MPPHRSKGITTVEQSYLSILRSRIDDGAKKLTLRGFGWCHELPWFRRTAGSLVVVIISGTDTVWTWQTGCDWCLGIAAGILWRGKEI
jgi:hypothetical protein